MCVYTVYLVKPIVCKLYTKLYWVLSVVITGINKRGHFASLERWRPGWQ